MGLLDTFPPFPVNTKKQSLHSRMHQSRSLLQSRSCWSVGSRRLGCRHGRNLLQKARRSRLHRGPSLGLCWREERRGSRSWGSPEQRRPLPLPSAGTPPSLPGHRCCCRGEDNPTHDEAGPQEHHAENAGGHSLRNNLKNNVNKMVDFFKYTKLGGKVDKLAKCFIMFMCCLGFFSCL